MATVTAPAIETNADQSNTEKTASITQQIVDATVLVATLKDEKKQIEDTYKVDIEDVDMRILEAEENLGKLNAQKKKVPTDALWSRLAEVEELLAQKEKELAKRNNKSTRLTRERVANDDLWLEIYKDVFKAGELKVNVPFDKDQRAKFLRDYNKAHKTNHRKGDLYETLKTHASANGVGAPTWNLK